MREEDLIGKKPLDVLEPDEPVSETKKSNPGPPPELPGVKGVGFALALLSLVVTTYGFLLYRLLSITYGDWLALPVLLTSLCGIGAAGAHVSRFLERIEQTFEKQFVLFTVAFGLSLVIASIVSLRIPLETSFGLSSPMALVSVLTLCLLTALPIHLVSIPMSLSLTAYPEYRPRLFKAILLGIGCGAMLVIIKQIMAPTASTMGLLALLTFLALFLTLMGSNNSTFKFLAPFFFLAGGAVFYLTPDTLLRPETAGYQPLALQLEQQGTRRIATAETDWDRQTVVSSKPALKYAPGLSTLHSLTPPPQLALYQNGVFSGALTQFKGRRFPLSFYDAMPTALGYLFAKNPATLILPPFRQADNDFRILEASYHLAWKIDVAAPKGPMAIRRSLKNYSGILHAQSNIFSHDLPPRLLLIRAANNPSPKNGYDVIMVDMTAPGTNRMMDPAPMLTTEGLSAAFQRLAPGGTLTVPVKVDARLFTARRIGATIIASLQQHVQGAGSHLVTLISRETVTFLVRKTPWTFKEIPIIKKFSRRRGFDALLPGFPPSAQKPFHAATAPIKNMLLALLNGTGDISPITDTQPYLSSPRGWSQLKSFTGDSRIQPTPYRTAHAPQISLLVAVVALTTLSTLLFWGFALRKAQTITAGTPWKQGMAVAAVGKGWALVLLLCLSLAGNLFYDSANGTALVLAIFSFGSLAGMQCGRRFVRSHATLLFRFAILLAAASMVAFQLLFPMLTSLAAPLSPLLRGAILTLALLPVPLFLGVPIGASFFKTHEKSPDPGALQWTALTCPLAPVISLGIICLFLFGYLVTLALAVLTLAGALFLAPGLLPPAPRPKRTAPATS